jgi:hypothetical protein
MGREGGARLADHVSQLPQQRLLDRLVLFI